MFHFEGLTVPKTSLMIENFTCGMRLRKPCPCKMRSPAFRITFPPGNLSTGGGWYFDKNSTFLKKNFFSKNYLESVWEHSQTVSAQFLSKNYFSKKLNFYQNTIPPVDNLPGGDVTHNAISYKNLGSYFLPFRSH